MPTQNWLILNLWLRNFVFSRYSPILDHDRILWGEWEERFSKIQEHHQYIKLFKQGGSRLRNKVSKSRHSLSDCFGKLIEASVHVFWSLREGFLISQLRFEVGGYFIIL